MNVVRICLKFQNKSVWKKNKKRLKNKKKNFNLKNQKKNKELQAILLPLRELQLEIRNQENKKKILKTKMFLEHLRLPFHRYQEIVKNLKQKNKSKNRNYFRTNKENKKLNSTFKNKRGKDRSAKHESTLSLRVIFHI